MYKLIITSFFAMGVLVAGAQTKLKVSLTDRSKISVELDYKHFHKVGTSITVGDLPQGRHFLRIFEERKNRFGRIIEDMVYEGKVKTYYGNITIFEYDPESGSINVYDENIDSFDNNPVIRTDTGVNNDNIQNNAPSKPVYSSTLGDTKLNSLKAKVDDINADTRKITELKSGLIGEKITTAQVGTMMDWFGFESSKEEFAEWAYDIVVDKENYGSLDSKFSYKEYQEMFENFLKKR